MPIVELTIARLARTVSLSLCIIPFSWFAQLIQMASEVRCALRHFVENNGSIARDAGDNRSSSRSTSHVSIQPLAATQYVWHWTTSGGISSSVTAVAVRL